MPLDILPQNLVSAVASSDTGTALAFLKEHQSWFTNPIEGILLHSKLLYYAIKNSKIEILQFLLNMPIVSDVPFFKFCGYTPISLAIEEGHSAALPLLLTKTDKNFALHMAVNLNLAKTKNYLLNKCVFKEKLLKYLGLK